MQNAGLAELGPYITEYRNWKLRVYEAVFNALKKYWTNERWIRVTDDDGIMQFVQVNALQMGPYGTPQMVNVLGQLDVDIVIDEGPDNATVMQDMYESLSQIVPAIAPMLKPPEVAAVITMLIETSPLSAQHKRMFRQASMQAQQPNPMAQQMQQLQLAGAAAQVDETKSKAILNIAKAQEAGMPEGQPQQQEFQLPPGIQIEQALADIDKSRADAMFKRSQSFGTSQSAQLEPIDYAQRARDAMGKQQLDLANLMHTRQYDIADLAMRKYEADSARQAKARSASST
jgi:hypothetical protein